MNVRKNIREKIQGIFKNRLFIFIATALVFSTIGVSAATYFPSNDVTYDNSVSGLESTNVQGAIDELYNACQTSSGPSIGNYILNNVDIVTSGDGLYKDEYEDGRYFYRGNVNNYITFNGEAAGWRIISVEADGGIKIMRNKNIENRAWDTSGSNNWVNASLNKYLNETYYNNIIASSRKLISAHDFGIGGVEDKNNNLAEQINDENATKWHGYIALPAVSDYIRTFNDIEKCGTIKLYNDNISCFGDTWMYNYEYWWFLSPLKGNTELVFSFAPDIDQFFYENTTTSYTGVRPTLYLSSKTQRTGGDGTQSSPYTIE